MMINFKRVVIKEGLIFLGVAALFMCLTFAWVNLSNQITPVMTEAQYLEMENKRKEDRIRLSAKHLNASDLEISMEVVRLHQERLFKSGYVDHILPSDIHERHATASKEEREAIYREMWEYQNMNQSNLKTRLSEILSVLSALIIFCLYPLFIIIRLIIWTVKTVMNKLRGGGTSDSRKKAYLQDVPSE